MTGRFPRRLCPRTCAGEGDKIGLALYRDFVYCINNCRDKEAGP